MNREEKTVIINSLADKLQQYAHFYLTDTSELNAEQTAKLRRVCFEKDVKLVVVKNTLFIKALEQVSKADAELMPALKGETSVMFSDTGKAPAKLIKEFRKESPKPVLKAAVVEGCVYLGDESIDALVNIKSREELIAGFSRSKNRRSREEPRRKKLIITNRLTFLNFKYNGRYQKIS